jgi:hypothetical protein
MSEDPKAGLSAALEQPGPTAPIDALRNAVAWASQWLRGEARTSDVTALKGVQALEGALADLGRLLSQVPALVQLAEPGPPLEDRITGYHVELTRLRAELADAAEALDTAGVLEQQIRDAEHERSRLLSRIEELQLGQRIVDELPGLRALQSALEAEADEGAVQTANEVRRGLSEAVRTLLKMTDDRRALLGADLARLLDDTAAADEKLAADLARRDELSGELDARTRSAEHLQEQLQQVLPALELQRKADQDLVDGLIAAGLGPNGLASAMPADNGLPAIRAALDDLGRRLADLDGQLRPLLIKHAKAYEEATRIRGW